jgi:plasmid stabilization system protein ParE
MFDLLGSQPGIGWPCRLSNAALNSVRVFCIIGFEKFLVFYLTAGAGIEILRILHSSQDLDTVSAKDVATD